LNQFYQFKPFMENELAENEQVIGVIKSLGVGWQR
jgi:hypothetical protein